MLISNLDMIKNNKMGIIELKNMSEIESSLDRHYSNVKLKEDETKKLEIRAEEFTQPK